MVEYSDSFYASMGKENYSAARIIQALHAYVQPASVLDVGCGTGSWLLAFQRSGAQDIRGLDGDYVKRDLLAIDPAAFTPTDLTEPFDMGRRYDLTICMEVGEHLPFDRAPTFVEDLCKHSNVVLFSAALPLQGGVYHVNERWLEYWAILFATQGFSPFDVIRPKVSFDKDVHFYMRQNVIVFANKEGQASFLSQAEPTHHRMLSNIDPALLFIVARKHFPHLDQAAVDREMDDFFALGRAWLAGETRLPALSISDMKTVDLSWDKEEKDSHRQFI